MIFQAAWWVFFGIQSIEDYTQAQLLSWQQSTSAARSWFEAESSLANPRDAHVIANAITEVYPDLTFDLANPQLFHVKQSLIDSFVARQNGLRRMFIVEAPFFALAVLVMLFLFAVRLRQADSLQRRQANFLSAVTHELRTPLSSLKLLVQTLRLRDPPPSKRDEYLQTMEETLLRLDGHANNLLAAARLDYDPHSIPLTRTNLTEVVPAIVGEFKANLAQRGAEITINMPDTAIFSRVHRDHLSLILGNLLDNAVKYTPDSPKRIALTLEATKELALLHVDDHGPGISNEDLAHVFDRFYRSGDELTRNTNGVGLGLFLTQDAAKALGGSVRAQRNPHHPTGTRFTVTLPRIAGGHRD